MVHIPNPFKRDDKGLEFRQNLALTESSADANRPNNVLDEVAEMTRKIGYLTIDETVLSLIHDNPELQHWSLLVSPLNSTANLSKAHASLQNIRVENNAALTKLIMSPETYEKNGMQVVEALRNYAHMRVFEAIDGWKGHLCTENVKRIEAGVVKK